MVRTVLTPREQLAEMLRQARLDAGYASHGALAKRLNVSRPVVTRAENPAHPCPSDAVLAAWAGATGVGLDALTGLTQRAKSGTPDWFMSYRQAEASADTLRCWAPLLCPGLLQCEAYARAVLAVEPYTPEHLDELVAARMERQQVTGRAYLTAVIDAHVLQRRVGSAAVMAEQCAHLVNLAARPNIALHVVPEGMNLGLWGAFDIAAKDGAYTVRMTTLQDVTSTSPDLVSNAMQAYERILGAAMPRAESLDFTRGMEEQWKMQI
jgi:transcriptional regulator with XRE-family HTH domain